MCPTFTDFPNTVETTSYYGARFVQQMNIIKVTEYNEVYENTKYYLCFATYCRNEGLHTNPVAATFLVLPFCHETVKVTE